MDAAYGRTFATELRWTPAGGLAVTSCGEAACRTRILERTARRSPRSAPTGPVVGVSEDGSVIAHEACGGLPCPLRRHAADGSSQRVAAAAGRAALAGDQLVFEADRGVLHAARRCERPAERPAGGKRAGAAGRRLTRDARGGVTVRRASSWCRTDTSTAGGSSSSIAVSKPRIRLRVPSDEPRRTDPVRRRRVRQRRGAGRSATARTRPSGAACSLRTGAPVPLDIGRHAAPGHEARDPRRRGDDSNATRQVQGTRLRL